MQTGRRVVDVACDSCAVCGWLPCLSPVTRTRFAHRSRVPERVPTECGRPESEGDWGGRRFSTTVSVMAGAGAGVSDSNKQQAIDDIEGFAVAVVREDAAWKVKALDESALTDLSAAETQLRELRAAGAVFGLLDIDDEFFIVVRPAPGGARLLISDATAAIDYDIAADVLDAINVDVPDLDDDELDDIDPWEEGDLGVLSDLGLPDAVMGVIVGDTDLYADEQIGMIAARLGFADELSKVLDSLGH